MNAELAQLRKDNQRLKEHLQSSVSLMEKYKREFGLVDEETFTEIKSVVEGKRFNAKDFDVQDRNGEQ
ncbi:hypothetical protein WAE58_21690 [Pedobacter panaciterrae]|uniref:Uncharacterized protein n=1 Tax=Pedobacter panaciterrae TaxID=363849 RepID=A0ABU8NV04_9SPHI